MAAVVGDGTTSDGAVLADVCCKLTYCAKADTVLDSCTGKQELAPERTGGGKLSQVCICYQLLLTALGSIQQRKRQQFCSRYKAIWSLGPHCFAGMFLVGRSLVDPAFSGSNKISLKLVRLQGRCAGETRCHHVEPPAEHTMTRASMPKPQFRLCSKSIW